MLKLLQHKQSLIIRPSTSAVQLVQIQAFSQLFRDMDKADAQRMYNKYQENKHYKRIMDQWQKPLMRKHLKKERKEMNPVLPIEPASDSIYVHDSEQGIKIPPNPAETFAVISIKGLQYKVTKDDRVMIEKIEEYTVGQQISLDEVLLVGTKEYTAVGRPTVDNARVLATIEELTQTEKVQIFKKRRRKNSQRNRGYRHWVTVLRIDKVEHSLDEEGLETKETDVLNLKPTVHLL